MSIQFRPDVVLVDVSMPRLNGIEAMRRILQSVPETRIIVVSSHLSSLYREEVLSRGAHGYVVKGSAVLQLPEAIEEVLNGRIFGAA